MKPGFKPSRELACTLSVWLPFQQQGGPVVDLLMNWRQFRSQREGLPDLRRPGERQRCVGFEISSGKK